MTHNNVLRTCLSCVLKRKNHFHEKSIMTRKKKVTDKILLLGEAKFAIKTAA